MLFNRSSLIRERGGRGRQAIRAASGKPYERPDVNISVAAPDSWVRVIIAVIPASGLYPCAGMASLPRASCLYILQTLDNAPFSILAIS
jgi:hypothetical protein